MAAVQQESMSVVDTAWLRMDAPDNLMIINGVLEFEQALGVDDIRQVFSERLIRAAPRFACRPRPSGARHVWEPVPGGVDWSYHLTEVRLAFGDAPDDVMTTFINQVFSEPLDTDYPLWRFYLFPDFKGGCAVLVRIHHCYADGIALISLMDAIADRSVLHTSPAARFAKPALQSRLSGRLGSLELWVRRALFGVGFGLAWLFEATRVLLLPKDNNGQYKQTLAANKQVAWAPSIPVDQVKAVGRAMGGTVNDVLVACAAGAMRRHLQACGRPVEDVSLRVTVPVNLRPVNEALQLGNHFGLVYLPLPVSSADPASRVKAVQVAMSSLKGGAQAIMSYGVLAILGHFPAALQRTALNFFSSKASAVMTNVPGPAEPIVLKGARVRRSMFWVPQSGGIGIGLSILSYDHKVEFGVVADTALVSDPSILVNYFTEEFADLRARAGL